MGGGGAGHDSREAGSSSSKDDAGQQQHHCVCPRVTAPRDSGRHITEDGAGRGGEEADELKTGRRGFCLWRGPAYGMEGPL